MIIASIFKNLFTDLTLTYKEYSADLKSYKEVTKDVQYHFGDSKELSKWIRGRSGKQKYPLIWYVIEPVDNSNGNTILTNCSLYLFTSTKTGYYNDTRALINYLNILDPLTTKVITIIESSNAITLTFSNYEAYYSTFDIPNYGVDLDPFDFKSDLPKGKASITVDIVDGRRIDFKARATKSSAGGGGGNGEGGGIANCM